MAERRDRERPSADHKEQRHSRSRGHKERRRSKSRSRERSKRRESGADEAPAKEQQQEQKQEQEQERVPSSQEPAARLAVWESPPFSCPIFFPTEDLLHAHHYLSFIKSQATHMTVSRHLTSSKALCHCRAACVLHLLGRQMHTASSCQKLPCWCRYLCCCHLHARIGPRPWRRLVTCHLTCLCLHMLCFFLLSSSLAWLLLQVGA